jgi:hypothetical protein
VPEELEAAEGEELVLEAGVLEAEAYEVTPAEESVGAAHPAEYLKLAVAARPVGVDVQEYDAGAGTVQREHESAARLEGPAQALHLADSPVDQEERRPDGQQHPKERGNGS